MYGECDTIHGMIYETFTISKLWVFYNIIFTNWSKIYIYLFPKLSRFRVGRL